MKFNFIVSKSANFFFFVDNISEWNIYCRKSYNKEWIKQFGKLNLEEKKVLKDFKILMQKYESDGVYKNIRNIFYEKQNDIEQILKKLEKTIKKEELNLIEKTFNIFSPRFEKIWKIYESMLFNTVRDVLKDYKGISRKLDFIYFNLSNFYGVDHKKEYLCTVFFIICPIKKQQGGKMINEEKIAIEYNELNSKNRNQIKNLWFLIFHELIHARFENKKYKNWLNGFIKKQTIPQSKLFKIFKEKMVLREMITGLATVAVYPLFNEEDKIKVNKKFKIQIINFKINDLNILKQWTRQKLGSTIKDYFFSHKKIDNNFLRICWDLIENYPKKLLKEYKK
jgi:DNA-directed RNA polymerase subunit F